MTSFDTHAAEEIYREQFMERVQGLHFRQVGAALESFTPGIVWRHKPRCYMAEWWSKARLGIAPGLAKLASVDLDNLLRQVDAQRL